MPTVGNNYKVVIERPSYCIPRMMPASSGMSIPPRLMLRCACSLPFVDDGADFQMSSGMKLSGRYKAGRANWSSGPELARTPHPGIPVERNSVSTPQAYTMLYQYRCNYLYVNITPNLVD